MRHAASSVVVARASAAPHCRPFHKRQHDAATRRRAPSAVAGGGPAHWRTSFPSTLRRVHTAAVCTQSLSLRGVLVPYLMLLLRYCPPQCADSRPTLPCPARNQIRLRWTSHTAHSDGLRHHPSFLARFTPCPDPNEFRGLMPVRLGCALCCQSSMSSPRAFASCLCSNAPPLVPFPLVPRHHDTHKHRHSEGLRGVLGLGLGAKRVILDNEKQASIDRDRAEGLENVAHTRCGGAGVLVDAKSKLRRRAVVIGLKECDVRGGRGRS